MNRARRLSLLVTVSALFAFVIPVVRAAVANPPGPGTLRFEVVAAGFDIGEQPQSAGFEVLNVLDGAVLGTIETHQLTAAGGGQCPGARGRLPVTRHFGGELLRCSVENVGLETQDGPGRNAVVRVEVVAPAGTGPTPPASILVRSAFGDPLATLETFRMLRPDGGACPGVGAVACAGDVGLEVDIDPHAGGSTARFFLHVALTPQGYQAAFSGSCTGRVGGSGEPYGELDLAVGSLATCRVTFVPPPPQPPALSVADLAIREGNSAAAPANVLLTMSKASTTPVTVSVSTANGTAVAPGDYSAVSGVATIPAGQTSAVVPVSIVGDIVGEPDETFVVALSAPAGASVADGSATVTIVNDDDRTAPVIAAKKDMVVESKLGPVAVLYASPGASDNLDGTVAVTCVAASGSKFAFGTTQVTCTAADRNGNVAKTTFNVLVRLPTTAGAVTQPGKQAEPLQQVRPGQPVQVDAGGFAPGAAVGLVFITATGEEVSLGDTTAGSDGRIDVKLKIPKSAAAGASQMTALGLEAAGADLVRAWLLTTVAHGGEEDDG